MPYRHEKFITAIIIIATLSLPLFSNATVGETVASVGISLGSKIDESITFIVSLPSRTTHALATTIDSTTLALRSLGETKGATLVEVSRTTYYTARHAYRQARKQIQITNNHIQSLLSLSSRAGETPLDVKEERSDGKTSNVKEPAVKTDAKTDEPTTNSSPLRIIERIITHESSNDKAQMTNQIKNSNDQNSNMQDPRVNTLITNVADLTSRVDEKGGSQNSGLSLTSLYNMIAQSQRIKTLDDVVGTP